MRRKLATALLAVFFVFSFSPFTTLADSTLPSVTVQIDGGTKLTNSTDPTSNVTYKYKCIQSAYGVGTKIGSADDWDIAIVYNNVDREYKAIINNLECTPSKRLFDVTKPKDIDFTIECYGENTIGSNSLLVNDISNINFVGKDDNAKLKLPYIEGSGDIEIRDLDLEFAMTASMNIMNFQNADSVSVINSDITINHTMRSGYTPYAALHTGNGALSLKDSCINIKRECTEDASGNVQEYGIICGNLICDNSNVKIDMNDIKFDRCAIKTNSIDYTKNSYTFDITDSEIEINIPDGDLSSLGIKGDTINLSASSVKINSGASTSVIGIRANSLLLENDSLVDIVTGEADGYNYGISCDGGAESKISVTDSQIKANIGIAESDKATAISTTEFICISSDIESVVSGSEADECYGIKINGSSAVVNSKIDSEVSGLSDNKCVSVYFDEVPGNIDKIRLAAKAVSDKYPEQALALCIADKFTELDLSSLSQINLESDGYAANYDGLVVVGEHADFIAKAEKGFCEAGSACQIDASKDFDGVVEFVPDSDKLSENTSVTFATNHIYSDCFDAVCDFEGCGYQRIASGHQYKEGEHDCCVCGYIPSLNITGLEAPVALQKLDTSVNTDSPASAVAEIEWDGSMNSSGEADYNTVYTATIILKPVEGKWLNSDTVCTLNGKSATVVKLSDGSEQYGIVYKFDATAKRPEPTDEPTPTPTKEPTPTKAPTPSNPPSTPTPSAAPELDVGDFVDRCYEVALSRTADSEGYAYWVSQLTNGQACGAQVGYGFIFSGEYLAKNVSDEQYVNDLYAMFFGREVDEAGYNYWLGMLKDGTATREMVFAGFANSLEFYNLCNKYGVVAGYYAVGVLNDQQGGVNCFVARLYKVCLGRLPDMESQAGWVQMLLSGEKNGTTCAWGFVFSPEFLGKNPSNDEFVNYMYAAFFGREADEAGFNSWVEVLNNGGAYEDVFNGFTGSAEFINLCASYGIIA